MRTLLMTVILLSAFPLLAGPSSAMMNPAAGYCTALGYSYSIRPDAQGNDVGYCTLPDGRSLYAWEFLLGETGQESSYCARAGYASRVVNDSRACRHFAQTHCLACVFQNGSAMEVTQAMGLDFRETICIRGTCRDPKDYPPPAPSLIPASGRGSGPSLPAWAIAAGLLVLVLIIAGLIAAGRQKG